VGNAAPAAGLHLDVVKSTVRCAHWTWRRNCAAAGVTDLTTDYFAYLARLRDNYDKWWLDEAKND